MSTTKTAGQKTKAATAPKPVPAAVEAPKRQRVLTPEKWQEIYEGLSEEQEKLFQKLSKLNDDINMGELTSAWEFGKELYEAHRDEATYGSGYVEKVSQLLGKGATNVYSRINFYRKVPSTTKLEELTAVRSASRQTLSFSIINEVVGLDDNLFWHYLNQAAENSWTVSQLRRVVKENHGKKREGGAGRRVSVPDDVPGKIASLHDTLSPVRKKAALWAGEEEGMLQAVKGTPPEALSRKWPPRLDEAIQEIDQTIVLLQQVKNDWEAAKEYVEGRLDEDRDGKKGEKPARSWREDNVFAIFEGNGGK